MARLVIHLLGGFRVALDDEPLTAFESDKTRALLAYLAVEVGRPHRRESLAELFWPGQPEQSARRNLRHTLFRLRHALRDDDPQAPLLCVTHRDVQINPAAEILIDVTEFTSLLERCQFHNREHNHEPGDCEECASWQRRAVELYAGDFLAGFSVPGSQAFTEWVVFKQEELHRLVLETLQTLADYHERHGDYEGAVHYAQWQIELEPWWEEAHRRKMRALELGGHAEAALRQFEICRRMLAQELGAEPSAETVLLYEDIRTRRSGHPAAAPPAPPSMMATGERSLLPGRVGPRHARQFVDREEELATLGGALEQALSGDGCVAMVTGDAGSGKSALVAEFARRACVRHGDLLATAGKCASLAGVGDPYLPFREALQILCGDLDVLRATGCLTTEHAQRLGEALPITAAALSEAGPALIDLFVPSLAERMQAESQASASASAKGQLESQADPRATPRAQRRYWSMHALTHGRGRARLSQPDLFGEVTGVFRAIAQRRPLLIVLDDLQWADKDSAALLFHLGRHLAGSRILLVGIYRPHEVPPGRETSGYPLGLIVRELQHGFGDIQIDLSEANGREFIDALVDSRPNHLGKEFRETLYRYTGGNALFTVELLWGLADRGDLAPDANGAWRETATLDWSTLPSRVEAVIAEHLGRVPSEWLRLLQVASVEGEVFTAEVAAGVLGLDEREVTAWLSGALSQQHPLVVAQSFRRLEGHHLSRYTFRHHLFWQYLYSQLDEVQRARLHEAVGNALEELEGQGSVELAPRLGWHFEQAGLPASAAQYLLQAGNHAMTLRAWEEALAFLTRGLKLARSLPASSQRAELEANLQLALADALFTVSGWGSTEQLEAASQAYELTLQHGAGAQLFAAVYSLAISTLGRGDHEKVAVLAEQLERLARGVEARDGERDRAQRFLAHFLLGMNQVFRGEVGAAKEHLGGALALYEGYSPDSWTASGLVTRAGLGPICRGLLAVALCALGYPEQAASHMQQAVATLSESDGPESQANMVMLAYELPYLLRQEDPRLSQGWADEMIRLVEENGLEAYRPWAEVMQGWARVQRGSGQIEEGLEQLRRGAEGWRAGGSQFGRPVHMMMLAEGCKRAGLIEQALGAIDEAWQAIDETGTRSVEADVCRLKGEFLLAADRSGLAGEARKSEAEALFLRAIELARRQEARWWELRAATSLARLWSEQGRAADARELLAGAYGWFTEGFDTPDLREAAALLSQLAPALEPAPR